MSGRAGNKRSMKLPPNSFVGAKNGDYSGIHHLNGPTRAHMHRHPIWNWFWGLLDWSTDDTESARFDARVDFQQRDELSYKKMFLLIKQVLVACLLRAIIILFISALAYTDTSAGMNVMFRSLFVFAAILLGYLTLDHSDASLGGFGRHILMVLLLAPWRHKINHTLKSIGMHLVLGIFDFLGWYLAAITVGYGFYRNIYDLGQPVALYSGGLVIYGLTWLPIWAFLVVLRTVIYFLQLDRDYRSYIDVDGTEVQTTDLQHWKFYSKVEAPQLRDRVLQAFLDTLNFSACYFFTQSHGYFDGLIGSALANQQNPDLWVLITVELVASAAACVIIIIYTCPMKICGYNFGNLKEDHDFWSLNIHGREKLHNELQKRFEERKNGEKGYSAVTTALTNG